MEFYRAKPVSGIKADYSLNKDEEEHFVNEVIEKFDSTYEGYFDQYKDCVLYENHQKLISEILYICKDDKKLRNLYIFFNECYLSKKMLYYISD